VGRVDPLLGTRPADPIAAGGERVCDEAVVGSGSSWWMSTAALTRCASSRSRRQTGSALHRDPRSAPGRADQRRVLPRGRHAQPPGPAGPRRPEAAGHLRAGLTTLPSDRGHVAAELLRIRRGRDVDPSSEDASSRARSQPKQGQTSHDQRAHGHLPQLLHPRPRHATGSGRAHRRSHPQHRRTGARCGSPTSSWAGKLPIHDDDRRDFAVASACHHVHGKDTAASVDPERQHHDHQMGALTAA
jgi:hypothetical protein